MNWNAAGSLFTGLTVLVGAWQVRRGRAQAIVNFEDDLSREYRALTRAIPMSVHLGDLVTDESFAAISSHMYQYIDLSNEQVFHRMNGRITKSTWRQWVDGMEATLALPAFARAWADVKTKVPNRFSELQRLEATKYEEDPRVWIPRGTRIRQTFYT